jgi:Zn-dependent alcohol dehydrogenases, class III
VGGTQWYRRRRQYCKKFILNLIESRRQGKFPFDEFVTYYDFADIEQAVEDSESGESIKPILRISDED